MHIDQLLTSPFNNTNHTYKHLTLSYGYIYTHKLSPSFPISYIILSYMRSNETTKLGRMTARSITPTALLVIIVILSPPSSLEGAEAARTGAFLSSVPSTQMPLFPESQQHLATMKLPPLFREHRAFDGREVKGCMPKGQGHSSAPSRFVNYQPLGSAASRCSPSPSVPSSPLPTKP